MELTFVFVVLAIVFVFYLAAYRHEMSENYQNEDYSADDYNNLDLALNKVLSKGDPVADAVEPMDEMSCFVHDAEFHKLDPLEKVDFSTEKENQYMFGKDSSIVRYNKTFYHDWRFPAKPVEIEFAMNPKEYIKMHPKRYPSYVYKTKDDLIV